MQQPTCFEHQSSGGDALSEVSRSGRGAGATSRASCCQRSATRSARGGADHLAQRTKRRSSRRLSGILRTKTTCFGNSRKPFLGRRSSRDWEVPRKLRTALGGPARYWLQSVSFNRLSDPELMACLSRGEAVGGRGECRAREAHAKRGERRRLEPDCGANEERNGKVGDGVREALGPLRLEACRSVLRLEVRRGRTS